MRIPLSEWEYINFSRNAGTDPLTPLMVGGFADLVGRVLPLKILEFNSQGETQMLPFAKTAISCVASTEPQG
jgi:hypothetical protein